MVNFDVDAEVTCEQRLSRRFHTLYLDFSLCVLILQAERLILKFHQIIDNRSFLYILSKTGRVPCRSIEQEGDDEEEPYIDLLIVPKCGKWDFASINENQLM